MLFPFVQVEYLYRIGTAVLFSRLSPRVSLMLQRGAGSQPVHSQQTTRKSF
jgi:hypothetical protein